MSYISAEKLREMIGSVEQKLISEQRLIVRAFAYSNLEIAQELGQYWLSKEICRL